MASSDRLIEEQIAYYQARAGEYDEWFLRQGRYDHGPEMNARWFAEVEQVARALEAFAPAGDVLELASGTGLWTQRLAPTARW
jgi:demethylmenaquinone methyltransferase/2-methoxy-6-polyprenyl-1,4-benzoquinol methylase